MHKCQKNWVRMLGTGGTCPSTIETGTALGACAARDLPEPSLGRAELGRWILAAAGTVTDGDVCQVRGCSQFHCTESSPCEGRGRSSRLGT